MTGLIYGNLPVYSVKGTFYDASHAVGKRFKDEITRAMKEDSYFNNVILPYSRTPDGVGLYSSLLKKMETFPDYMEELKGLADGVGVSHELLTLWNMEFEWTLYLKNRLPDPSCSDLYLANGDTQTIMGHNEDGNLAYLNTSYIVRAIILDEEGEVLENFTAFCYPGRLCGGAFSFNQNGLVMSTNALFPIKINPDYLVRSVLNRALLPRSPSEAIDLVDTTYCSSGFSLNLGDVGNKVVWNIEVSPVGANPLQMHEYDYHFNMYLRQNVSQAIDPSSEHRLERVRQLPPPKDAIDIRSILGDTEDKEYPIFRTGSPPDTGVATLATAVFDLVKCTLHVYRGNPSGSAQPTLDFRLC